MTITPKHKVNYIRFVHGASSYMIEHLTREDGSVSTGVYKSVKCQRFGNKFVFAFPLQNTDGKQPGMIISDAIKYLNKQRPVKLAKQNANKETANVVTG